MKSALRRVRGEGNLKCDDSTDKFRDWDSDRGLSKKLPKTCGYHQSIPKANGARLLVRGLVKRPRPGKARPNRLSNSTLEFHQTTYQKP